MIHLNVKLISWNYLQFE